MEGPGIKARFGMVFWNMMII